MNYALKNFAKLTELENFWNGIFVIILLYETNTFFSVQLMN